jgi:hypothetical protein
VRSRISATLVLRAISRRLVKNAFFHILKMTKRRTVLDAALEMALLNR